MLVVGPEPQASPSWICGVFRDELPPMLGQGGVIAQRTELATPQFRTVCWCRWWLEL